MNTVFSRVVGAIGLLGASAVALAGEPKPATPHEPIGFVTGGVIGAFAAGPVGAVVGAGLGTWLGNRVHRAKDATKAEATVAALQTDESELRTEKSVLLNEKKALVETNRSLTAQFDDLTRKVEAAQNARAGGSEVLDGLQGDVLFRTGSAEITPEIAHQIQVLALAVAKSPELKVRVDGYADPRGTVDTNLKLSEDRANAVRDLFLAAGIAGEALEVNAYGKSQSVAADSDGYALERRVRLTVQAQGSAAVAQAAANQ
ncbi:MAG TPA: OmpA family protein [Steroidobacteraceae bacterium]|jgi:outer membrane protein OmpA-like peptidoglycan-associated protein|nr:OmpA family protein [Steroidobacteraceae bacterium]